ncbi:MAG: hypothetical protein EOP88_01285 [Verrucomicrobiaceae bacterium]|nr:MAG: hypothetical protein EOP88_01285 [Verrucomicrobiaceae bacterium]
MNIRLLSIIPVVVLALAKPAAGQDAKIQIRALLNDPSKRTAELFVGKPGESMTPLQLAEEGFTEPQQVTLEDGTLKLFSSATVDKTNPQASLAGSVKIPASFTRVMLIIVPGGKGRAPYLMVPINDDPKSFPWGESRALNMTAVDFALEVGDQKLVLPGGKITEVPKVTKVDEYNRAQTNFYYKQGDQWVIAAERQMQYVSSLRRVFLIYKSENALAPDVRTILDQPPPVFENAR